MEKWQMENKMDKKLEKRNWIAEVAFLGVKEHIVLLIVADLTLPY